MTRDRRETSCDALAIEEIVARLREAGFDAINDSSGTCHSDPVTGHHHDRYVTIRRLPLRDAERLLRRGARRG